MPEINKENQDKLNQEMLKELLSYSSETGDFTWKVSRRGTKGIGSVAGSVDKVNAYTSININDTAYRAHRLAWLYVYGTWPAEIDHISHNRADNRIANLREVDRQENLRNTSMMSNNTSGVNGVTWNKQHSIWRAQIRVSGKQKHLGSFKDKAEAIAARQLANVKYGYHKLHGTASHI